MNERIREILVQCQHESVDGPEYPRWTDLEKFAELIVGECLDIIETNNPCPPGTTIIYSLAQEEYFDKGWQVAVETKSNQIQKYFGVEK